MILTPVLLSLAIASADPGPVYRGIDRAVQVSVPHSASSVVVDGVLDEPVWTSAARLTGFSQYSPADGRPAVNDTVVLVWYSSTAIYFGIQAHAEPGSVRATLADRDHIDADDSVQIFLTTFNDGRQATVFGVNPLGVQLDGALIEGAAGSGGGGFGGLAGGREAPDLSPDYVFSSKGRLTDYGYEVEIRIPFKSLRYQASANQTWGIHVIRRVQSSGHEDSWVPANRSAASFLTQSGTLTGLQNLRRGLVLDLNPVATARSDGGPSGTGWAYDAGLPEFGGNVRWGVTPNLTLNATLNPDFSQVESDASQFQFDPRQALFFAEKRPFFLDGIEFFSTPNNLVYSRRVVAPIAAAKLTGKAAGNTVAVLSAVDGEAQSSSGHDNPFYNILRVQRDVGSQSRAGFIYTDKIDGNTSNRVAGADTRVVWRSVYAFDAQAAVSRDVRDGQRVVAPLWQASVNRTGRRVGFRYSLRGVDENFRSASGFINRAGVAAANITHQLTSYGRPGALLERWTGDISLDGTWQYEDFVAGRGAQDRKLHFNNNFTLHGGWRTGVSLLVETYGYDRRLYKDYAVLDGGALRPFVGVHKLPNLDYVFTLNTPPLRGLSTSITTIWGKDDNFFEWASADIVFATLAMQWRPSERLRVDGNFQLQSYRRRTDDSMVSVRRIPRLKLEYQATRSIFVRWVGEYVSQFQADLRDDSRTNLPIVLMNPDGSYAPAVGFRRRTFRNDVLFSYQPTPGTVLFAGYGATMEDRDVQVDDMLRRTRDGFFLKLSYLFRM